MIRLTLLLFLSVMLCFFNTSCSTSNVEEVKEPLLAEIIIGADGHFRGRSIGDALDAAVTTDREFLFKRTRDELNYSIPFSPTDSAHYDVAYVFDQFGLFEIQVDVYSNTDKETKLLYTQFKSLLIDRYGSPIEKEGSAFWSRKEGEKHLEITLRDESEDYGKPFLSLNILEPQSHNF
jgi:hypothetical protein